MEENNSNQPNSPVVSDTPMTPEVPLAKVGSENNNMEVHPVPTLVIEDTTSEDPVTVEAVKEENSIGASTNIVSQVVSEVKEIPINSEIPESPEVTRIPNFSPLPTNTEVKIESENPSEIPNETPTSTSTEEKKPEKKNHNTLAIIVIILCLIGAVVYYLLKNNNGSNTPSNNNTNNQITDPNQDFDVYTLAINQAYLNGITFNFPETKTVFNNVGWTWDANYAKNDVEPATSTNGGRLGSAPGGAVVMVYNKGTSAAHIEDCEIFYATFYNPKDGSENVSFVGGLGYTSSLDTVKNKMKDMGYLRVDENTNDSIHSLKYYLNDDKSNQNSYIEFNFNNDVIESITISTNY